MDSLNPHDRPEGPADPHPSGREAVDDVRDDASNDASNDADHDVAEDGAGSDGTAYDGVGERDVPTAPTTGDAVVDAAMIDLAAAEAGSLAERIEAGERAHRVLQGRLSDLGGA